MSEIDSDRLLAVLSHILTREGSGMVYLDIVKIFYLLRKRLNDENELKPQLQYYWYIDGPESDTVQKAVNHGVQSGILEKSPTTHTGTGTWFEPVSPNQYLDQPNYDDDDVEEAIEAVDEVLEEEYDLFDQKRSKIEPIYEEAPYEFQRHFKFEIAPEIEHFVNEDLWACSPDKLNTIIATSEAYLPLDPAFDEFNDLYSWFVEVASRYLRRISETGENPYTREFQQLAQNYVWNLFSHQLRIQHHDDYYDDSVEEWEEKYEQQRMAAVQALENFEEDVETMMQDKPASDLASPGSAWASIAADYIEN